MIRWSPAAQPAQQRVLGRHAAREAEPVCGAFERRRASSRAKPSSGCRSARTRSPACSPTASWAKVDERWIGVTTAPVCAVGVLAGVDARASRNRRCRDRRGSVRARSGHRDRSLATPDCARNASASDRVRTPTGMAAVEHEHRRRILEALHRDVHRLARCRRSEAAVP